MTNFKQALKHRKTADRAPVHSFHRYFGKLIPAIPGAAIECFSPPDGLVLDPFCGSGTSLVEAQLQGRASIGIDVNPLSTLISAAKTTPIDSEKAESALKTILQAPETEPLWLPYVVNREHWFRPEAINGLANILETIKSMPESDEKQFSLAVLSAVVRNCSNADPQHVFPGISKRVRASGKLDKPVDVPAIYERAYLKRFKQVLHLPKLAPRPRILTGAIETTHLDPNTVDLVVTNPPYISSIHYLETLKLEMGWLGYIADQAAYSDMDKGVLGTERFKKAEYASPATTSLPDVNRQIEEIFPREPRIALVIATYFSRLDKTMATLASSLKHGGHLVFKIAPSRLRGHSVNTPAAIQELLSRHKINLIEEIRDPIDSVSRSLHTARNYYSGQIDEDHLLIFQKQ